jgi:hypothetical protein
MLPDPAVFHPLSSDWLICVFSKFLLLANGFHWQRGKLSLQERKLCS